MIKRPTTGTALRRQILAEHDDLSTSQLALLDLAAAALDEALRCDRVVRKQGMTVVGARGVKPHPLIAVGSAARGRLLRALAALAL